MTAYSSLILDAQQQLGNLSQRCRLRDKMGLSTNGDVHSKLLCNSASIKDMSILCRVCQNPISAARVRRHAKSCSYVCTVAFHKSPKLSPRHGRPRSGLSTPTVGALAELMVAVDLMRRGYEVFRALSPSASCDLAILGTSGLRRVEVR